MSEGDTNQEATGQEATTSTTEQSNADIVAGAVNSDWQWSDTVKGEGAAPEWLKGDKYKTVEAQAKAYTELEGKFGSFTGAPEEYALKISDELKEKGVDFSQDDPIVQEFSKWAKESNLSQEGFNGLVELKGMMDIAEQSAQEEFRTNELKALGNNAQARVDNLNSWANANLAPDMLEGFQEMASSAKAVEALEGLIAKTRNAPISPESLAPQSSVTSEDLRAMQFETDQHGNRKLQNDPEFRARFNKMAQEVWGADPARQTIG
jgi:Phage T7 capsid assembly protein